MAFLHTTNTNWGITVSDSYCRVEAVLLTDKDIISFHLRFYASPEGVPFFKEQVHSCEYNLAGDNPIKQAYEYLKTLPEFADAVDC